jgi:hypothetical protein
MKQLEYFIKGPIPISWIAKANRLGGTVGIVGLALWFYQGIHKGRPFSISKRFDEITGVTRQTRQSSLKKLHLAGLIDLDLKRGAYPVIRIIHQMKHPQGRWKSLEVSSSTPRDPVNFLRFQN